MTCIVGIETPDGVVMGGDSISAATWGNYATHIRTDDKVFKRRGGGADWLFGVCGDFRCGQLLHYSLTLPRPPGESGRLMRFMCTTFINAVRRCFRDGGWLGKDDERHGREHGGLFLVAVRGQLFEVHEELAVGRMDCGYAAAGCGRPFAMGAMHAMEGLFNEMERVERALRAAEELSGLVRGPFVILKGAKP